jgi:hypothetical protein
MKRRSIALISVLMPIVSLLACSNPVFAQSGVGDQFLDGIGETALIARYVLNGNAEDWSRNNYHATLHGAEAAYVEDSQFCKVLSLPGGDDGGYVQIPGQALMGVDTVSITGWLYVRSEVPWQRFFDFGQDTTRNFFCTPIGEDSSNGYRARITNRGWTEEFGPVTPRVATNKWVHLAVVLDAAEKMLSTYLDGVRVGYETDVDLTLEHALNQENTTANLLYIGRSQYNTDSDFDAKIHDVRIYSIALTDKQVATIRNNALSDEEKVEVRTSGTVSVAKVEPSATIESTTLTNTSGLTNVPDITVETVVGTLPHLPYNIPGVYRDGTKGPLVRVIWPAPTDNSQVLEPGTYTVTGTVSGTKFRPKATVTVKEASDAANIPHRNVEPFPLGQVILNRDENGRATQFIKNRDKFILTLAKTNPDNFLFNFRDAFGQPQPEGVRPLRVWDSRTTRLRGHASGHYLSAIAQAYASTTYDQDLHANFLQKMNYLIDTLYDLSQKSGKPVQEGGEFNADPTLISARRGFVPTIGTGARALSAPTRRTNSSCWRRAPRTAVETTRFGLHTIPCIRFWPACSIVMKSAATKRPARLLKVWDSGFSNGSSSFRQKPVSACGIATSPVSMGV